MNIRMLIERAAKAVGLEGVWWSAMQCLQGKDDDGPFRLWSPMTDEGDRYRLAKQMNMTIMFAHGIATGVDHRGRIIEQRFTPGNGTEEAVAILRLAGDIAGLSEANIFEPEYPAPGVVVETNKGRAYRLNGLWFMWHNGHGSVTAMKNQAGVTEWRHIESHTRYTETLPVEA